MISEVTRERLHDLVQDESVMAALKEYLDDIVQHATKRMRTAIREADMHSANAWQAQVEFAEELLPTLREEAATRKPKS